MLGWLLLVLLMRLLWWLLMLWIPGARPCRWSPAVGGRPWEVPVGHALLGGSQSLLVQAAVECEEGIMNRLELQQSRSKIGKLERESHGRASDLGSISLPCSNVAVAINVWLQFEKLKRLTRFGLVPG